MFSAFARPALLPVISHPSSSSSSRSRGELEAATSLFSLCMLSPHGAGILKQRGANMPSLRLKRLVGVYKKKALRQFNVRDLIFGT